MTKCIHCDATVLSSALAATPALCSDCPPVGYPTDKTRCDICPRHSAPATPGCVCQACQRSLAVKSITGTAGMCCECVKGGFPLAATPAVGGEPVAWLVPSDETGFCRIWWRDKERAEAWLAKHPTCTLMPLYASPLRGRNRDLIALDAAHQIEALPSDLHEAQKTARIQLIVLDAMASPPEQPARPQPMFSGDRDPLKSIVEWTKEVAEQPAAAPDKER